NGTTSAQQRPASTSPSPTPTRPPATSNKPTSSRPEMKEKDGEKSCPGVCVAEHIADYCEAVLDIPSLCKPGVRCCVSRDVFDKEKPPPELIIMDRQKLNKTTPSAAATTPLPPRASTPSPSSTAATAPSFSKPCRGECVSGLFALFCDDVDTEASCPGDDSCCITNPVPPAQNKQPEKTTEATTTTVAANEKQPSNLPKCPGFCLLSVMASFCDRPSVVIQNTANCARGSVCCDNTRGKLVIAGNAEMTDVFKCRKSGTQCCAPKSVIREVLDQRQPPSPPAGPAGYTPDVSRNDTYSPLTPIYPPYKPSPGSVCCDNTR
ncbi:UNVERIFIED_CONTAM: hypothetical protein B566_EDAN018959, partial [Ephemera danica]